MSLKRKHFNNLQIENLSEFVRYVNLSAKNLGGTAENPRANMQKFNLFFNRLTYVLDEKFKNNPEQLASIMNIIQKEYPNLAMRTAERLFDNHFVVAEEFRLQSYSPQQKNALLQLHFGCKDLILEVNNEHFQEFMIEDLDKLRGHPKEIQELYGYLESINEDKKILEKLAELHASSIGSEEQKLFGKDSAIYKFLMNSSTDRIAHILNSNEVAREGQNKATAGIRACMQSNNADFHKLVPPELLSKIAKVEQKLERNNSGFIEYCWNKILDAIDMITGTNYQNKGAQMAENASQIEQFMQERTVSRQSGSFAQRLQQERQSSQQSVGRSA